MAYTKQTLRARGVALIISNPRDEILIIQELQTKPHFGKYAGMFSPPMETSQKGERDCSTVGRLIDEELPGLAGHIKIEDERCGVYRIVPGVWVSLYVGHLSSSCLPTPTESSRKEVGGYAWVFPDKALTFWLRQGAREMLTDYIENRKNVVCRFCRPPATQALSMSQ